GVERRDRTSLEGAASASMVFAPKPASSAVPSTGSDTNLGEPPSLSSLSQQAGPGTVRLDPAKLGHKPQGMKRPKGSLAPVIAVAAVAVVGAGFAAYELAGRSRIGDLNDRYTKLVMGEPAGNDAPGWGAYADEFDKLAGDFDSFSKTFGFT